MPYSDSPSLRLRRLSLTLPPPISRRLILPQAHGQIFHPPTACRMTVSCSFSLPCMGFFFTFPSRYFFTIGHPGVFSLTRWSSPIHTGFHVPHATRDKGPVFCFIVPMPLIFQILDFHHLWCRIQLLLLHELNPIHFRGLIRHSWETMTVLFPLPRPPRREVGLGCSRFARRY